MEKRIKKVLEELDRIDKANVPPRFKKYRDDITFEELLDDFDPRDRYLTQRIKRWGGR